VKTDLSITGKVAQFGRGVLGDVSAKLLGQFVERLEADVLGGEHGTVADASSAAAATPTPTATTSTAPSVPQSQGPRRIESAEVEPVDLLATAGAPVGRRLIPVAIGAIVAFLLFRRWRKSRF